MSLIPVLLLSGNVELFGRSSRTSRRASGSSSRSSSRFFIFLVSGFAETNRLPFDLPEAESELIAGYHTEYSAMKFSMFFIAEYANMVTVGAMVTTLFFGGWDIPFTDWDEPGALLADPGHLGPVLLQGVLLDLLRHVDPLDPARGSATTSSWRSAGRS